MKIEKWCPNFRKKVSDCVNFWITFSIQNIVLRVSRRKHSTIFPCVTLFPCLFFNEGFFQSSLVPQNHLPKKIFGCAPGFINYFFCKTLHLKSLTVFSIPLCLSNCSVICTATLRYILHVECYYVMHCITHIQNSGIFSTLFFSGICRQIQSYPALLRHIHEYWGIIKAYSGLFRHIHYGHIHMCNPSTFETLPHSEPWHI